jgi:hypothetical protein
MTNETKIHVQVIGGNLFAAATFINKAGWSDYLLQMDYLNGVTRAVLRMPTAMVHALREKDAAYISPIDHDDPVPVQNARPYD